MLEHSSHFVFSFCNPSWPWLLLLRLSNVGVKLKLKQETIDLNYLCLLMALLLVFCKAANEVPTQLAATLRFPGLSE